MQIRSRRTVRMFSTEQLKMTPFGPALWQRVLHVVPTNNLGTSLVSSPDVAVIGAKRRWRRAFYGERASEDWLDALAPIGAFE